MENNKWKFQVKDLVWIIVCLGILICGIIGVIVKSKENAFDILSSASTVASIILSMVAMIYTMVSGYDTNQINKDTQNKLESIENKISEVENKLSEQKTNEQKMREIITAINKLENENPANLPEGLNKLQDSLCSYFDEDIEL